MATSSIITRGSSSLANFTVRSRSKVDIILANQTDGLVPSFTTGDTIKGTVTITVDHDTRFDDLEITFEGTSRTSVERQSMPGRTGAYHTFLRLRQPIDESAYPTPRVLEPGRNYEFPFTFVVPERLLPHICNHAKTNLHVEQSHTLLPPTFGDPMIASNRKSVIDDMAPEMCRISYLVRVTLQRKPVAQNASPVTLVSAGKKVRVIPAVDEEPPLNVDDNDGLYSVRKEKDVKRGLMRGKLGRLVLAAAQPKPVQLSPSDTGNCDSVSTVATMQLRFDPVGNEQPPRLGTVWSKLRVSTFYSSDPWGDYPSAACIKSWAQMGRAMYTETVPLSTMCVASAQWTKHTDTDTDLERRDSMHSTSSTDSLPGPSASFAGNTYYTASVVVPVTLPKAKSFVPTFYSCLIARAYALELSISYHAANSRILTPTASLKVPLQLTCEAQPGTRTKGTVVDISQDEVNTQFFSPRSIAPPSVSELVPIAPPAYTSVQVSNLPPDRSRMLPPSVTTSGSVRV